MIVLKRKTKTTKSIDHRNVCLNIYTAKRVVKRVKDDWKENQGCLWRGAVWIEKGKRKSIYSWNTENNIKTNFGNKWLTVCVLHRFAEGIWPSKLDQVIQPVSKLVSIEKERENIDQLIYIDQIFKKKLA